MQLKLLNLGCICFYIASSFTLFYILICQSVAELEQKWQSEVDDAIQGKLENNMPFFYDYHFNEVSKSYDLSLGYCYL